MKKKQTAVELLEQQLKERYSLMNSEPLFEQAKAMEKEQIVDAYTECWMNDGGNGFHKVKEAEQYYNETYGETKN
jgi:hypothetical protein